MKKEIGDERKTGNCTVVLGYRESSGFCVVVIGKAEVKQKERASVGD